MTQQFNNWIIFDQELHSDMAKISQIRSILKYAPATRLIVQKTPRMVENSSAV